MAWLTKMKAGFGRHLPMTMAVGVGAVVVGYMYPETFGMRHYQNIMSHYKHGGIVPIDNETQQLIEKVLYRINLPIESEGRLDFFNCILQDPVRKGSLQLRTGALIGLPVNFTYKTVDDIDSESVLVDQKMVDWNSAAAKELQKSLVLSDKAKAFAIAREVNYANTYNLHVDAWLVTVFMGLAFVTNYLMNEKFWLTSRLKLWMRVSASVGIWVLVYIYAYDAIHCMYDSRVDKKTARLRKIYAEGGVEYYEAVLQRNRALRTLMGAAGNKKFTYYGNVVSLWRNRSVQLTSRRDRLMKYLAEYDGQQGSVSVTEATDDSNQPVLQVPSN